MIYFIQAEGIGHIKIGFTDSDDASVRLATLQTGSPVPLRLLGTFPGLVEDEKNLHRRFASAKVHGEWFKPIPELMRLISPTEVLSCDGIEAAEKSVSIRVLSVGRKQFTRSLLDQLPLEKFVSWTVWVEDVVTYCDESQSPADVLQDKPLQDYASTSIWGWVGKEEYEPARFHWVIFESGGRLCKGHDWFYTPQCPLPNDPLTPSKIRWLTACFNYAYPARKQIPGLLPKNQLFIGV